MDLCKSTLVNKTSIVFTQGVSLGIVGKYNKHDAFTKNYLLIFGCGTPQVVWASEPTADGR